MITQLEIFVLETERAKTTQQTTPTPFQHGWEGGQSREKRLSPSKKNDKSQWSFSIRENTSKHDLADGYFKMGYQRKKKWSEDTRENPQFRGGKRGVQRQIHERLK